MGDTAVSCLKNGVCQPMKLQYFGHLMWRAYSLENTLMLGKIEGRWRRGWQRMRWLDGITNSRSLPKLMSIESLMLSNHLILCHPLLHLSSIFLSIRVFSNESDLHIRWPKYWSFSFSISPSNDTQDWSPLGWTGWISLQSKGLSRVFSNITVQKHQFFSSQFSL